MAKDAIGENMRAADVEKYVKNLENFGGIYKIEQLKYVKICSLPVSLVIFTNNHWIGVYITENVIEIMDSSGFINKANMPVTLRTFLRIHAYNKRFFCTPRLQPSGSTVCGLFVVTYLIFKNTTNKSLCDFCQVFSSNFSLNYEILLKLFKAIKQKHKK